MEQIAKDFVTLLQYLLPGFLAAWVFYGLTSYPRPSQFERVVQALIFTLIVQSVVFIERFILFTIGEHWSFGKWNNQSEIISATLIAFLVGATFSYFANFDGFHKLVRKAGITRETSYPSEWFGAFLTETYIVLHFKDDRRLYGWPKHWPSDPTSGHFVLEKASWIRDEVEQTITGVERIMVDVNEVRWVEFMEVENKENV